ncbi:MAG: phosphoglucosamine mutase [Clostridia bacterium]|nr:phosphoglucosamine mutase [Clostridia bacterium]
MGRLFGTDGVRGVVNKELTADLAMKVGNAAARVLTEADGKRPVIALGMDTRISGDFLAAALAAGICAAGADVLELGVVPTPAVAYLVRKYKADAGVMISASHNPAEYNGIKIFSGDGYKLPDLLEEKVETLVLGGEFFACDGAAVGRVRRAERAVEDYVEYLASTVGGGFKVRALIDCANGSASVTAPVLFPKLCDCDIIFAEPDGVNINAACGSTHMEKLCEGVVAGGYDLGIAFDGDADRCLMVDAAGEIVDGDMIMAMASVDMKQRGTLNKNTVVGTIMTNFGFNRFCSENGIAFIPTKVGDRFVLEEMLINGYSLGGEQSGHIIFKEFATTGDGQLTALQVLDMLTRSDAPIGQLKRVMTRYPQHMINVRVSPAGKERLYTDSVVRKAIDAAKTELGSDGRIVVRESGTEPLIRVMVECGDEEKAQRVVSEAAEVIRARLADK